LRLILDLERPLEPQLAAAKYAIDEGIKKGDRWGVKIKDTFFGVKYNATSIRVYPND
jgi:hypothetical protein